MLREIENIHKKMDLFYEEIWQYTHVKIGTIVKQSENRAELSVLIEECQSVEVFIDIQDDKKVNFENCLHQRTHGKIAELINIIKKDLILNKAIYAELFGVEFVSDDRYEMFYQYTINPGYEQLIKNAEFIAQYDDKFEINKTKWGVYVVMPLLICLKKRPINIIDVSEKIEIC